MLPLPEPFICFSKITLSFEEFDHVLFDYTNPKIHESEIGEDEIDSFKPEKDIPKQSTENLTEEIVSAEAESATPDDKVNISREWKQNASYPVNFIMEKPDDNIQTRSSLKKQTSLILISQMEPKRINEI